MDIGVGPGGDVEVREGGKDEERERIPSDVIEVPIETADGDSDVSVTVVVKDEGEGTGNLALDPSVTLSQEMCVHVLSFLTGEELANCSLVSRSWQQLADHPPLWKGLCQRRFFVTGRREPPIGWKAEFVRRRHRMIHLGRVRLSDEFVPSLIAVGEDGRTFRYIGTGVGDDACGGVQAEEALQCLPFGNKCVIAYFEVHIINPGAQGECAVGIGLNHFPKINSAPGWRKGTYGYHGDDGRVYLEAGFGRSFGPKYTDPGDVVGCGVVFEGGKLFFTKNGQFVGFAKEGLDYCESFFAIAGLHTVGAVCRMNLGAEEFVFDVASFILEQESELFENDGTVEARDDEHASTPVEVNWDDLDPFEDLIKRIDEEGSEEDEEFVTYCRRQIGDLDIGVDVATLPPDQLFQAIRALANFYSATHREAKEYEAVPEVKRPALNGPVYTSVRQELTVLSNPTYLTTLPGIQTLIQNYALSAEATLGRERWAGLSDEEKRRFVATMLRSIVLEYEVLSIKKDIAILKKSDMRKFAKFQSAVLQRWHSNNADRLTHHERFLLRSGINDRHLMNKTIRMAEQGLAVREAALTQAARERDAFIRSGWSMATRLMHAVAPGVLARPRSERNHVRFLLAFVTGAAIVAMQAFRGEEQGQELAGGNEDGDGAGAGAGVGDAGGDDGGSGSGSGDAIGDEGFETEASNVGGGDGDAGTATISLASTSSGGSTSSNVENGPPSSRRRRRIIEEEDEEEEGEDGN